MYLIRHGETDWNVRGKIQGGGYDIPLNANGRRQAHTVARELQDIHWDIIASSDMHRARETADILMDDNYAPTTNSTRRMTKSTIHSSSSSSHATTTQDPVVPIPPRTLPRRIIDPGLNEMRFGEFEGFSYDTTTTATTTTAATATKRERLQRVKNKMANDPTYCFPTTTHDSNTTTIHATSNNTTTDHQYRYRKNRNRKRNRSPMNDNDDNAEDDYDEHEDNHEEDTIGESTQIVEERSMNTLFKIIQLVVPSLKRRNNNTNNNNTTKCTTTTKKEKEGTRTRNGMLQRNETIPTADSNTEQEEQHQPTHKNRSSNTSNSTTINIAIVAHGRTNKIMLASMIYGTAHPNFQYIQQGNCAINVVELCGTLDGSGDYYHEDAGDCDNKNNNTSKNNDDDDDNDDNTHMGSISLTTRENKECTGSSSSSTTIAPESNANATLKWVALTLNYTDHVKDHVITR